MPVDDPDKSESTSTSAKTEVIPTAATRTEAAPPEATADDRDDRDDRRPTETTETSKAEAPAETKKKKSKKPKKQRSTLRQSHRAADADPPGVLHRRADQDVPRAGVLHPVGLDVPDAEGRRSRARARRSSTRSAIRVEATSSFSNAMSSARRTRRASRRSTRRGTSSASSSASRRARTRTTSSASWPSGATSSRYSGSPRKLDRQRRGGRRALHKQGRRPGQPDAHGLGLQATRHGSGRGLVAACRPGRSS